MTSSAFANELVSKTSPAERILGSIKAVSATKDPATFVKFVDDLGKHILSERLDDSKVALATRRAFNPGATTSPDQARSEFLRLAHVALWATLERVERDISRAKPSREEKAFQADVQRYIRSIILAVGNSVRRKTLISPSDMERIGDCYRVITSKHGRPDGILFDFEAVGYLLIFLSY